MKTTQLLTLFLLLAFAPILSATESVDGELNFDHLMFLREFSDLKGNPHFQALFGVKPSESEWSIERIIGPKFFGNARSALLNETTLSKIYAEYPISPSKKQELLQKYQGTRILFFEGEQVRLCNGQDQRLRIEGRVGNKRTETVFSFAAYPGSGPNCNLIKGSAITQF